MEALRSLLFQAIPMFSCVTKPSIQDVHQPMPPRQLVAAAGETESPEIEGVQG